MRRLASLLFVLCAPGAAAAEPAGRHFAHLWDAAGPEGRESDVQLWLTPRWGRGGDGYTAVDLRAGVLQGFGSRFAAGFFVDAALAASGTNSDPGFEGRLTLLVHRSFAVTEGLSWALQAAGHFGLESTAATLLLVADAQLGPTRIALNLEGHSEGSFKTNRFERSRLRQTLGLAYTLPVGFSIGLEVQNRLSWAVSSYVGDALLIGPSLSLRRGHFWLAISLLPQVAALKGGAGAAPGATTDALELTDNERFALRLSLGVVGL